MSDPYYEDEYEDIEDYEPDEWSFWARVEKAANGQLFYSESCLWKYPGEDWGEASGWSYYALSLRKLSQESRDRCIELGRDLKPGEYTSFHWDEDDEEHAEDSAQAAESSNDGIPF